MSVQNVNWDPALLDSILTSLAKAGLYERAGELYEHMARSGEAMQSYRRGHAYRKAIDLARREFPSEVRREAVPALLIGTATAAVRCCFLALAFVMFCRRQGFFI